MSLYELYPTNAGIRTSCHAVGQLLTTSTDIKQTPRKDNGVRWISYSKLDENHPQFGTFSNLMTEFSKITPSLKEEAIEKSGYFTAEPKDARVDFEHIDFGLKEVPPNYNVVLMSLVPNNSDETKLRILAKPTEEGIALEWPCGSIAVLRPGAHFRTEPYGKLYVRILVPVSTMQGNK